MNLSHLKQLVRKYDKRKGLRRRLFGDAFQIQVLKELISDKEADVEATSDPEITLQEYQSFASNKGYSVDLFTLFRYPINMASTAPQYGAGSNEEDDNDDSYNSSPICAPAA